MVDPNPYPPTPAALQKLLQCATAAQDWPEAAAIALLQYTRSPETAKSSFSAVLAGARKTQEASATMQPDNPVKNQNLVERDMVNFSKPFDKGVKKLVGSLHNQVCRFGCLSVSIIRSL